MPKIVRLASGLNIAQQIKNLKTIGSAKASIREQQLIAEGAEADRNQVIGRQTKAVVKNLKDDPDAVTAIQQVLSSRAPPRTTERPPPDVVAPPAPVGGAPPAPASELEVAANIPLPEDTPAPVAGFEALTPSLQRSSLKSQLGLKALDTTQASLRVVFEGQGTAKKEQWKLGKLNVNLESEEGNYTIDGQPVSGPVLRLLLANQEELERNVLPSLTSMRPINDYKKLLLEYGVNVDSSTSAKANRITSFTLQERVVELDDDDGEDDERFQSAEDLPAGPASPRPRKQGAGLKPRIPTRTRISGDEFGTLKVNMRHLKDGMLELYRGKELVFKQPVSQGVRFLLMNPATKARAGERFNEADLMEYHKLAKMAGISVPKQTAKGMMMKEGVKNAVFIEKDPVKMAERLETLIALKEAGKHSEALLNEAMTLNDALLRMREISKATHKNIFGVLTGGSKA
jgi:hypothetical protein